jgi:uncharacterized protein
MNATRSMTRRRAFKLIGAATLPATALSHAHARDAKTHRTRNVLFFTKSGGFEHDVVKRDGGALSLAEKTLTEIGKRHNFDLAATKDGRVFDGELARYDGFCFFTHGNLLEPGTDQTPPVSKQGKAALLAMIRGGKGFLGLHSASDTFHSPQQDRPDPYITMLGSEFHTHGEQQEARVNVVDRTFPGLPRQGFQVTEEWYSLKNFARDLHVLLTLETNGTRGLEYRRPRFPIAWARQEGKGRVYYNAMGHREDVWMSKRFPEMLAGALAWTTRRVDVALVANIAEVTPRAWVMPPDH